jgi:O-antigen/teichoic acid export membrane protein
MHNSLYRNSIFLMMSTGVTALLGFIFWTVSARLYSPVEIGLATTIISSVTLLSTISQLGLNNAIIRYLPGSKYPNRYINSPTLLVLLLSAILGTLFLVFINDFSSRIAFIRSTSNGELIFLAFVVLSAVNGLTDGVFIGSRVTQFVLYETVAASLTRLLGTFVFHGLHAYGIIYSSAFGVIMSLIVTYVVFFKRFHYRFEPKIRLNVLLTMGKYSMGSYVGNLLITATPLILPLIITNRLGAANAAFFYIAMTIASFLYYVPQATTLSLFAEGVNNDQQLTRLVKHSFLLIGRLLLPGVLLILLLGSYVLAIFGHAYNVAAVDILRLLAIAAIPLSINYVLSTYFRIRDRVWVIAQAYIVGVAFILLTTAYISKTLDQIGIVWLLGQLLILTILLLHFVTMHRERLLTHFSNGRAA